MREPGTARRTDPGPEAMHLLVRGWMLIGSGATVAVIAGYAALVRSTTIAAQDGTMNTTPHLIWAALGAVGVICGTVLVAAARVVGAIRAEQADRSVDAA